jgi:hypothetical protein
MNVKELKNLAKKKGIKGYYKMRKDELEIVLKLNKKGKKTKSPNKSSSPRINLVSAPKKFKTKKFAGVDSIDTYASMLYLAELFKDECIIIPHSDDNKFKISKNAEFHDITLTWDEKSNLLWEPVNFWKYIRECDNSTKRFIMIPFGFECKKTSNSHANFLIYDKYENTLERFEPHGQFKYDSCMRKDIDDNIKNVFKENFNSKIKYLKPIDYLPKKGFQTIQENEDMYDLAGYCGIWSAYYAILRLKNPDINRKIIVEKAIKALNNRSQSYSEFIRDYGQIVKKLSSILKKSKTPEKDFAEYIIDLNQNK